MSNIAKISQLVAKILRFFKDFSRGPLQLSCIFKFYWLAVSGGPDASLYKIS